jgi:hypothetical protein
MFVRLAFDQVADHHLDLALAVLAGVLLRRLAPSANDARGAARLRSCLKTPRAGRRLAETE